MAAGGVGKWGGLVSGCVTAPSQPSDLGEGSEGLELQRADVARKYWLFEPEAAILDIRPARMPYQSGTMVDANSVILDQRRYIALGK